MSLKHSDTEHKIDSEDFFLYIGGQNMSLKERDIWVIKSVFKKPKNGRKIDLLNTNFTYDMKQKLMCY